MKNGLVITDKPEGKRKIFDHRGHHVGTVGPLAGVPTVSRFLGHHDVTLKGNAWHSNKPSRPTRPDPKLAKSLRSDKGSNGPTLAEVSAKGATTARVGGGQS